MTAHEVRHGRSMIPAVDFDQLVAYLCEFENLEPAYAARAVDQMLAYLVTQSRCEEPLFAAEDVELAWRAFIVHTDMYRCFCSANGGRFIDYYPPRNYWDKARRAVFEADTSPATGRVLNMNAGDSLPARVTVVHHVHEAGFAVDWDIWVTLYFDEFVREAERMGMPVTGITGGGARPGITNRVPTI